MKKVFFAVPILLVVAFLAAAYVGSQPKQTSSAPSNVIFSVKTDRPPILDGQPEASWDKASPITLTVSNGANAGDHEVTLKSIYTGDSIYFLAQWTDQIRNDTSLKS